MKVSMRMLSLACALAAASVHAQAPMSPSTNREPIPPADARADTPAARVDRAARIVERMKANPEVRDLMRSASGLFIVPNFDRQVMQMGQRAEGVLVVRRAHGWSEPLFYETGPILLGAHAGAGISALAAILLKREAIARFADPQPFILGRDGGFNLGDHDAADGPFPSEADEALMWSDAAGLFPGAAVHMDRVRLNEAAIHEYHGRRLDVEDLVVDSTDNPRSSALHKALSGL